MRWGYDLGWGIGKSNFLVVVTGQRRPKSAEHQQRNPCRLSQSASPGYDTGRISLPDFPGIITVTAVRPADFAAGTKGKTDRASLCEKSGFVRSRAPPPAFFAECTARGWRTERSSRRSYRHSSAMSRGPSRTAATKKVVSRSPSAVRKVTQLQKEPNSSC